MYPPFIFSYYQQTTRMVTNRITEVSTRTTKLSTRTTKAQLKNFSIFCYFTLSFLIIQPIPQSVWRLYI